MRARYRVDTHYFRHKHDALAAAGGDIKLLEERVPRNTRIRLPKPIVLPNGQKQLWVNW